MICVCLSLRCLVPAESSCSRFCGRRSTPPRMLVVLSLAPHGAYIRSVDDARRLLRRQPAKVDLDRLVLPPTFWALQTRPSQLTWMRRLISAEVDDRVAELEVAMPPSMLRSSGGHDLGCS